jgi:hypothetical protein
MIVLPVPIFIRNIALYSNRFTMKNIFLLVAILVCTAVPETRAQSDSVAVFFEIRAYTKAMLNFGEETVFSRVFPVFDAKGEIFARYFLWRCGTGK